MRRTTKLSHLHSFIFLFPDLPIHQNLATPLQRRPFRITVHMQIDRRGQIGEARRVRIQRIPVNDNEE